MVVMMENKSFGEVIGQASEPFTNSLVQHYGLATRSYAFGHPSLPNYLDLVSGSSQGVGDDGPPASHSFPGVPTIATQLAAAGVSEKAYAEDLPADPSVSEGDYAVKHFPWAYFPTTSMPVAPATSLRHDLDSPHAPDFVWYTPNLVDDEHDGTVEQGDAFLSRLVPEVQATAWYRDGGQIVIEWDEADGGTAGIDGTGGGHVPTIVVSAALASAPRHDATPVDTAGILASIETCYGVGYLAQAADPANGTIGALLHSCRPAGAR
ncbi:MAG: alkaline phosphatase family protein [Acidimicrobiales bacterium]